MLHIIFIVFDKMFLTTIKVQKFIYKFDFYLNTAEGTWIHRISFFIWFCSASFYILLYNESNFNNPIVDSIFLLILMTIIWAYDLYKIFVSLRYFLFSQFFVSVIIFVTIRSTFNNNNFSFSGNKLFILILLIVCCLLSITVNSTVSVTGNTIIAGLVSLMLIVSNTLIAMIPSGNNLPTISRTFFGITATYTFQEDSQIEFNLAILPILIINGTAAILAALKSYWVKKYNDGKEISWNDFNNRII